MEPRDRARMRSAEIAIALFRLAHRDATRAEQGAAARVVLEHLRVLTAGRVSARRGGGGGVIPSEARSEVLSRVSTRIFQLATRRPDALFQVVVARPELAGLLSSPPSKLDGADAEALVTAGRLLTSVIRTIVARTFLDMRRESDEVRAAKKGFELASIDGADPVLPSSEPIITPTEARVARAALSRALERATANASERAARRRAETLAELLQLSAGEVTTEALVCRRLEQRTPAFGSQVSGEVADLQDAARRYQPRSPNLARATAILVRGARARDAALVHDMARNLRRLGGPDAAELVAAADRLEATLQRALAGDEAVTARYAIHQAQSRLRRELRAFLTEGRPEANEADGGGAAAEGAPKSNAA